MGVVVVVVNYQMRRLVDGIDSLEELCSSNLKLRPERRGD